MQDVLSFWRNFSPGVGTCSDSGETIKKTRRQEEGSGLDDRIYRLSHFMKILLVKKNRLPTVRPWPHFLSVFINLYQIECIKVSFVGKEFFQII